MSLKKQTDFTFDEAKKAATHHISIVASFMEDMSDNFPKAVPYDWAILLKQLELKVNQSSNPNLNIYEIKQVDDLAKQLIHANPDTEKQLEQFWDLYAEVYRLLQVNPNNGYAPQGIIDDELDRIRTADTLAERLVLEAKNRSTYEFVLALLLAHVVRTETIGYAIWKQLCDVIETFKKIGLTKFTIDNTEFMCSVNGTFLNFKNKQVRSDVKTIRDSIAHAHFKIQKVGQSYGIEFNNKHYRFEKTYSLKEFGMIFIPCFTNANLPSFTL